MNDQRLFCKKKDKAIVSPVVTLCIASYEYIQGYSRYSTQKTVIFVSNSILKFRHFETNQEILIAEFIGFLLT